MVVKLFPVEYPFVSFMSHTTEQTKGSHTPHPPPFANTLNFQPKSDLSQNMETPTVVQILQTTYLTTFWFYHNG